MLSSNDKSKLLAGILCEIRKSEIAAARANAMINRLRVEKGLEPIFIK